MDYFTFQKLLNNYSFEKENIKKKETPKEKNIIPEQPENNLNEKLSFNLNLFSAIVDSTDSTKIQDSLSFFDSTSIIDTTMLVDTTDPQMKDSTARLKYFKHQRTDSYAPEITSKKQSKFFTYPSSSYIQKTVQLDSSGQYVLLQEKIAGQDVKTKLKIPIDEYIDLRIKSLNRKLLEDDAYKYELKSDETSLEDLIENFTNFEIPLPDNSIFSIFGPPSINLSIRGSVTIHGAWRTETTEGVTASRLGNTKNEPDFKQTVQISVNGMIGDKLSIKADWNTERTFEYENQLKIKYTGYEDEIIQSVEAGNVSMNTSNLVGGSEALFGIKAQFKMGPFSLTALLSQKKSEVEEVSITGGAQSQTFELHAYDYSTNHYFIDSNYASSKFNLYNDYFQNSPAKINPRLRVKELEVWKSVTGKVNKGKEVEGVAFITLNPKVNPTDYDALREEQPKSGEIEVGRFELLTEDVHYDYNEYIGLISFKIGIQDQDVIAVSYRVENDPNSNDDDLYYGEFVADTTIAENVKRVFKLVKPENLSNNPGYKDAWKLMVKSIYPIGGKDIKKESFVFDIKYLTEGSEPQDNIEGKKLLELFGFDKYNSTGAPAPDGTFDFDPGRTIFTNTGEIIFPVLQPFGKDLPQQLDEKFSYQSVYDTTKNSARKVNSRDKYLLTGQYSAAISQTYNIGFNAVENSVKVMLNGAELTPGVDYQVDYAMGVVKILNDQALLPNADLKITYEKNDLFQLASKTLVGLRGIYDFSKRTQLGFSFLNLNQKTLSDKVRIGEEPMNNSIWGVDFKTGIDLPFLTNLLDNVISTKTLSKIDLVGEFAYSDPDPNTKKSTIQGDNDQSVAYIDDFEGAKRIIPVGISYTSWRDCSVPNNLIIPNAIQDEKFLIRYKARSFWFNILPSDVNVVDIWPEKKAAREDQQITVLDYVYKPGIKGMYNWYPKINSDSLTNNWSGMMKPLSSTANNLLEENIEYIEFWAKVIEAPQNAKLFIDLGQISEDAIPNDTLDSEDKNLNDAIDEGEDLGIDGYTDDQERGRFKYTDSSSPYYNDPSGDNFIFKGSSINRDDYMYINGTQGNAISSDVGLLPNTEDLNRNFNLDKMNNYFRYEVTFDTTTNIDGEFNNMFISGGGKNAGWYQFRIPLDKYVETVGEASLTQVETIRLWVTGVDTIIHLRLAEMNLVGSQWEIVDKTNNDSVLTVSTISIEENPGYTMPPGLERETDRTKADQDVKKNEQSLVMHVTELKDGAKREIEKKLPRAVDIFNYAEMKFFIHGDPYDYDPTSVSFYENDNNYGAEVYFQFGADSNNFYEYRQPVHKDWNEVKIVFSELTSIKEQRGDSLDNILYMMPVPDKEGHTYGVKGKPTLTRISFFKIGIHNPIQIKSGTSKLPPLAIPVSGDIWINELRVLGANETDGWAYRVSTSFNLADLLKLSFNLSSTDPYFHKLNERFGSRNDSRNWGFSAELDLLKLIPLELTGSSLTLKYSRNESVSRPLFLPGTDIEVNKTAEQEMKRLMEQDSLSEEEAQEYADKMKTEVQTVNVKESWSLSSIKIVIPSEEWYIKHTINSLSFGFNYSKSFGRNPTTLYSTAWDWGASMNYSLNLGNDLFFYPANIPLLGYLIEIFTDYRNAKIYYVPQTFSSSVSVDRDRSESQNRNLTTTPNIQRDFKATRGAGFNWKITEGGIFNWNLSYTAGATSTLAYLLTENVYDNNGVLILDIEGKPLLQERNNSSIFNDIFTHDGFGKDISYSHAINLKTSPKLPSIWDIDKFFNINAGYSVSYNWSRNIQQGALGMGASYSNSYTFGLSVKWKSLWEPLFKVEEEKEEQKTTTKTTDRRKTDVNVEEEDEEINEEDVKNIITLTDTTITDSTFADSTFIDDGKPSMFSNVLFYLTTGIKWLLIDYDNISINFSQKNSMQGGGLLSHKTGFSNFWGISHQDEAGPSRWFQLGFSSDLGPRAPKGNLSDKYSQTNTVDFKTSRPLWTGAKLDLRWRISWGMSKTTVFTTDEEGNVMMSNQSITSTGTLDKSFLSISFPLLPEIGIKKVYEIYNPQNPNSKVKITDAFVEGFETLPIIGKLPFLRDLARYIPRPNWSVSWDGFETLPIINMVAQKVTLNHGYDCDYAEGWKINTDGNTLIQSQKISYGFSPLLGFDITFFPLWEGNLRGKVEFRNKTDFNVGVTTNNITETLSDDITISASYSKSGFELPLFGITLKNDIEISISFTSKTSTTVLYDMGLDNNENPKFKEDGEPQDGSIRTTIEPRIKYVMSSKVTLSAFWKNIAVKPQGASRIPETTTNEFGLDVNITI
ncbi:MAG: cell surface protein SprA [Ignavibacteriales bacterium]|nr:cell surface protein SprA [Ignavibacteriales bacterium]